MFNVQFSMFNLPLSFHILDSLNAVALELAIDIDDNSDGHSTFGSSNTNHKECHKHTLHPVRIEQAVDGGILVKFLEGYVY